MKFIHYINKNTALAVSACLMAGAAMGMLSACKEYIEVPVPVYTVGEAVNAITLRAGISEGGSGVQTRATRAAEDHHTTPGHNTFTQGTKLALRVDGTWLSKADGSVPHGTISSTLVSQKTTATIGEGVKVGEETAYTHNKVTFTTDEQLYWDDYGTADPANKSVSGNGRDKGLTIYGVAVDGKMSLPTTPTDLTGDITWNNLSWNVGTSAVSPSVINQTTGWGDYDLLTSNNIKDGKDGTYKFDALKSGSSIELSNLLEFTHAMTKITVNLKAGDGFANSLFVNQPEVTLLGFNYTGTVNVESKTSTPSASSTTNILAHLAKVKETTGTSDWSDAPATWAASHQTQFDALVFPGNIFENATEILTLSADSNVYQVTAAKLNAAIEIKRSEANSAHHDAADNNLLQGVNYVLNITVNKTSIDVTATIKDWEEVTADQDEPIISIGDCYGQTTGNGLTNFQKGFTFYRSLNKDGNYLTGLTEGNKSEVSYSSVYTMTPSLYWPDHKTHYFFRGIWPLVGTDVQTEINQNYTPVAKLGNDSDGKTKIKVENVPYKVSTFPSDLMIGMPRDDKGDPDETCKAGHTIGDPATPTPGICATDAAGGSTHGNEGLIHMNFQYAMSQVIVKLTTSTTSDQVTFDEHTVVKIIDGLRSSVLYLSDGSTELKDENIAIVGEYPMTRDSQVDDAYQYHDAIIPQPLADGNGKATLKFRITVGSGSSPDVYETVLGIKNINGKINDEPVVIDKWEPGKKYIYNLYITKTDIVATATIKDWVTVTASDKVWF